MTTKGRESGDLPDDPPLEDSPLSLDVLLDLLASERRRALLDYLSDQPDNEEALEEAAREAITRIGRNQGDEPNCDDVQASLRHHHISKLEEAGVIEYDSQRQRLRYTGHERLETIYDRVTEFQMDTHDPDGDGGSVEAS